MFEKLVHWKKWHWFLFLCGVTLLLFLLLLAVYRIRVVWVYNAELELLRKAGFPASANEFVDPQPPVPDSENGALVLKQAGKAYLAPDECNVLAELVNYRYRQPPLGVPMQEIVFENAAKYCAANQETFRLARQALKYDKFNFEIKQADEGIFVYGIGDLSKITTLLLVKTDIAVHEGRKADAIEYIVAVMDIENVFVPELRAYALFRRFWIFDTLERTVNLCEFDDAQLKAIYDKLSSKNMIDIKRLKKTVAGQLLEYLDCCDKRFQNTDLPEIYYIIDSLIGFNTLLKLRAVIACNLILSNLHLPYKQQAEIVKASVSYYEKILLGSASDDLFYTVTREMEWQARLAGARTAIAIERFKLKYKKLPEKLDELVPEFMPCVPKDPFDDQPIRYRQGDIEVSGVLYDEAKCRKKLNKLLKQESDNDDDDDNLFGNLSGNLSENVTLKAPGYVVYSVGHNMVDDGGDVGRYRDITFCVVGRRKLQSVAPDKTK